jgi:hypothetical protein
MNLMRTRAGLALIAIAASACSTGAPPDPDSGTDLPVEQRQWEAAALADYRFDFQQQCFCVREQVQPVTIEVRDGAISRVVSRETGDEVVASEGLRWHTIADLFGIIDDARERGVEPLVVHYDAQLGYPVHIEAGSLAADAGIIYTASNLQPLSR